ncbi:MAG: trypsin-like peptidase domain-containing protein [Planctomycetaceae bacterium]
MKYFAFRIVAVATLLMGATSIPCQAQQIDPLVAKLFERERQVQDVIRKVAPAVVAVTDQSSGWGSGVIVSADGLILTAGHVTMDAGSRGMKVHLADGTIARARTLGRNMKTDSGLLKLESDTNNGKPWPFVEVGRSNGLKRGDWTVGMGHPGGLEKGRPAPVRLGRILSLGGRTIVTDGTIIVGDSGGPLFDLTGRVIGVHSMIGNDITNNRHVAIDVVKRDWARLEDGEAWGKLGDFDTALAGSVMFGTDLSWTDYEARVADVMPGSPAAQAGLRSGDRLLKVDGQAIADQLELSLILGEREPGDRITVEYQRSRQLVKTELQLGPFPRESRDPMIRRSKRAGIHEKAGRYALAEFRPVSAKNRGSTVRLIDAAQPQTQLALGAVVSSDGYIVTKYTEINDASRLICELPDGSSQPAELLAWESGFDLALLKVEATNLRAIKWQLDSIDVGQLLVSPFSDGAPMALGVVSVRERKLAANDKAFLGVSFPRGRRVRGGGAVIAEVVPDSAAERAGLRDRDKITQLNDRYIANSQDLIGRIAQFKPGDEVRLRIERRLDERTTKIVDLKVALSSRFIAGDWRRGFQEQNMLGPTLSNYSDGFPLVLQHDTVLQANQCGGPLLNLQGEAVGINIARAGRVMSYAIPAGEAKKLVQTLMNRAKK